MSDKQDNLFNDIEDRIPEDYSLDNVKSDPVVVGEIKYDINEMFGDIDNLIQDQFPLEIISDIIETPTVSVKYGIDNIFEDVDKVISGVLIPRKQDTTIKVKGKTKKTVKPKVIPTPKMSAQPKKIIKDPISEAIKNNTSITESQSGYIDVANRFFDSEKTMTPKEEIKSLIESNDVQLMIAEAIQSQNPGARSGGPGGGIGSQTAQAMIDASLANYTQYFIQITEGGKIGYTISDADRTYKGFIGTSAIDFSFSNVGSTGAIGDYSFVTGVGTIASGLVSTAEGVDSQATGTATHAEGFNTYSAQTGAHSEGVQTYSDGYGGHAEGYNTSATQRGAHSEGDSTIASGIGSHSEGRLTQAVGTATHAEGSLTYALGNSSHAEGGETVAIEVYSHAEGYQTSAMGYASHAGGVGTITNETCMYAIGKYNDPKIGYQFQVGVGIDDSNRANGLEVDVLGEVIAPIQTYSSSASVVTKGYVDYRIANNNVVGTPNQIYISPTSAGGYQLSTPQDIATTSMPTFSAVTIPNPPTELDQAVNVQFLIDAFSSARFKGDAQAYLNSASIPLSGYTTIDGVALQDDDIVIRNVGSTEDQENNGLWVVTSGAWYREFNFDEWNEMPQAVVVVTTGQIYSGTRWYCNVQDGGTVDVTPITFVELAGGGGVGEAPVDGKTYGRKDSAWNQVVPVAGGTYTGQVQGSFTSPTLAPFAPNNGNAGAAITNPQIAFGYAGSPNFRHYMSSRHSNGVNRGWNQAIDFRFNDGVSASEFGTSQWGVSMSALGVAVPDGSATQPSYTFGNGAGGGDLDTGLYHPADGQIAFTTNGVKRMQLDTDSLDMSVHQIFDDGKYMKINSDSADTNDGRIGHNLFAKGLNILGIDRGTDTTRHISTWGIITQRQAGDVISCPTAPTDASHLTRKDYVDARTAGYGTYGDSGGSGWRVIAKLAGTQTNYRSRLSGVVVKEFADSSTTLSWECLVGNNPGGGAGGTETWILKLTGYHNTANGKLSQAVRLYRNGGGEPCIAINSEGTATTLRVVLDQPAFGTVSVQNTDTTGMTLIQEVTVVTGFAVDNPNPLGDGDPI
jgi:hypothetical protein